MLIVAKPSPSFFLLHPSSSSSSVDLLAVDYHSTSLYHPISSTWPASCKLRLLKNRRNHSLISLFSPPRVLLASRNSPPWSGRQRVGSNSIIAFCSLNDAVSGDSSSSPPATSSELSSENPQSVNGPINDGAEELELLGKPSPKPVESENGAASEPQKPDKDEALAPFLKFFKPRDSTDEGEQEEAGEKEGNAEGEGEMRGEIESKKVIEVEYYEPKPGDFVVGVVVYGNENKLDVNIGADFLGAMLTKEVLPLYEKEIDYLLCDLERNVEEFMDNGKMGLIRNEEALSHQPVAGRPVVEAGTVLFAEVLGRTLSGRPLLSSRRFFRRIAWHRVRQIQQLNEPIQVRITEWNTGGLLTRIEGLRAFLPKAELTTRVNNFAELKENVGRHMYVQISRINEETNDLILSERQAWENVYLREGTLFEGTVKNIFPYGAQIKLGETSRSGLLHMSNISRGKVTSVADLLSVDEKVKVLVLKSLFPNKISLSIAELESEPGLFITDKERVFAEAEQMAKKYRQNLPPISTTRKPLPPLRADALPYQDESSLYANWKWFKF